MAAVTDDLDVLRRSSVLAATVAEDVLQEIWQSFSTEVYCAGWMDANPQTVREFWSWVARCAEQTNKG